MDVTTHLKKRQGCSLSLHTIRDTVNDHFEGGIWEKSQHFKKSTVTKSVWFPTFFKTSSFVSRFLNAYRHRRVHPLYVTLFYKNFSGRHTLELRERTINTKMRFTAADCFSAGCNHLALAHRALTSFSLMSSHLLSWSICLSRSLMSPMADRWETVWPNPWIQLL